MSHVLRRSLASLLIIPVLALGCTPKSIPKGDPEKPSQVESEPEPSQVESEPEPSPVESEPEPHDFTNSVGMEMRLIPAGEFLMGSPEDEADRSEDEGPVRRVNITTAYYLGVYEVTQGEWEEVMETTPWHDQIHVQEEPDCPATYVNWTNAEAFCEKLSELEGRNYRLPTEAEWEYACRAGGTTTYSFGDSPDKLEDYAWYLENAYDVNQKYAAEVGQKLPNAWGLHDMHGNVFEWCQDWYSTDYTRRSLVDPTGPRSTAGVQRVQRGGCWRSLPQYCRSAARNSYLPSLETSLIGFRLACSVE